MYCRIIGSAELAVSSSCIATFFFYLKLLLKFSKQPPIFKRQCEFMIIAFSFETSISESCIIPSPGCSNFRLERVMHLEETL